MVVRLSWASLDRGSNFGSMSAGLSPRTIAHTVKVYPPHRVLRGLAPIRLCSVSKSSTIAERIDVANDGAAPCSALTVGRPPAPDK